MKYLAILATAAVMLLSGCATTIHSNVTAFNDWPADIQDKSYAFEAPQGADDTLEHRNYQALVATELNKLGFHQATGSEQRKAVAGGFQALELQVLQVDAPAAEDDRAGDLLDVQAGLLGLLVFAGEAGERQGEQS